MKKFILMGLLVSLSLNVYAGSRQRIENLENKVHALEGKLNHLQKIVDRMIGTGDYPVEYTCSAVCHLESFGSQRDITMIESGPNKYEAFKALAQDCNRYTHMEGLFTFRGFRIKATVENSCKLAFE